MGNSSLRASRGFWVGLFIVELVTVVNSTSQSEA